MILEGLAVMVFYAAIFGGVAAASYIVSELLHRAGIWPIHTEVEENMRPQEAV